MKACRLAVLALAAMILSGTCGAAAEFKNGTAFALGNVPKELVVERRAGEPVRFSLEENQTTGFSWEVESNTNECEIALERRGRGGKTTCGAPGNLDVTVTSRIYTPARVEFRYRRPREKDAAPWKAMRLALFEGASQVWTPFRDGELFRSSRRIFAVLQNMSRVCEDFEKEF